MFIVLAFFAFKMDLFRYNFFGGDLSNLLRDRDNFALSMSYSF